MNPFLNQPPILAQIGSFTNNLPSNTHQQHIQLQTGKSTSSRLKQKPQRPIQVLSDEQEEQIINKVFEEEVFRSKIQQAKLTKSKYNILKVLYMELNFKNLEDSLKQKRFNSMVKVYISKNLKTSKGQPFDMKNSNFFPKMFPKPQDQFIQNEYMLYGCDLLSQKSIEKLFQAYTPSIKWIDSSHCKLTFLSKMKGWQAVINNIRDFLQFKKDLQASVKVENLMNQLQLQHQEMQEQHQTKYNEEYMKIQRLKHNYHLLRNYTELMPYFQLGFKRRLSIRNVTAAQQKIGYNLNTDRKSQKSFRQQNSQNQIKKPQSDFKKYLKVKETLWKQIANSPLVKPEFEKIEKQIEKQQQLLWHAKKPGKPYLGSRPFNDKRQYDNGYRGQHRGGYRGGHRGGQRGGYQNRENANQLRFDQTSQRSFNGSNRNSQRNRSRNPSDRYTSEMGGCSSRGQSWYNKNKQRMSNRYQSIQKHFDQYIQQRQGLRILQNPHQFLQPSFIDEQTGVHFYRNPFYNSNAQRPNQSSYYQNRYSSRNHPNQQFQYQDQTLSEYEYQGSRPQINANYHNNFNQRGGNSHAFNRRNGTQVYQNAHRNQFNRKPNNIEDQFEQYCANRQTSTRNQDIQPKVTPQTVNVSQYQTLQRNNNIQRFPNQFENNVFENQVQWSMITEQKPQTAATKKNINHYDENLQNILNEIHGEQQNPVYVNQVPTSNFYTQDDGEDSEGLQFIIEQRQREGQFVKNEVKHQNSSKRVSNSIPTSSNYIVQTIKEQHLPGWLKTTSHNVDDSGNLSSVSDVIRNQQNSACIHQNSHMVQSGLESNKLSQVSENIKKKIPHKKVRNGSESSKKRGQHSASKNSRK